MSENTNAALETTLVEDLESEETELTLEEIVEQVVGESDENTAYAVAKWINEVFAITSTAKEIPTQMLYNYTRNGMVAKGKKGKASDIRYTNAETKAFVLKYTNKYVQA